MEPVTLKYGPPDRNTKFENRVTRVACFVIEIEPPLIVTPPWVAPINVMPLIATPPLQAQVPFGMRTTSLATAALIAACTAAWVQSAAVMVAASPSRPLKASNMKALNNDLISLVIGTLPFRHSPEGYTFGILPKATPSRLLIRNNGAKIRDRH